MLSRRDQNNQRSECDRQISWDLFERPQFDWATSVYRLRDEVLAICWTSMPQCNAMIWTKTQAMKRTQWYFLLSLMNFKITTHACMHTLVAPLSTKNNYTASRTNNHSTTRSIPDTAVYPTHTAVPELPGSGFDFQWKPHACAARDLAKSGQGYWDPVELQVQQ